MSYHARRSGRQQPRAKPRRLSLQKPNGVISPRVRKVVGEHFAIVCVDPAKHRSEWMMADYFGNLLIEPQTVEHQSAFFKVAVEKIRQAQQQYDIQDTMVVVERTGNYYLPPKRAFATFRTSQLSGPWADVVILTIPSHSSHAEVCPTELSFGDLELASA